jgi:hypothetical protein
MNGLDSQWLCRFDPNGVKESTWIHGPTSTCIQPPLRSNPEHSLPVAVHHTALSTYDRIKICPHLWSVESGGTDLGYRLTINQGASIRTIHDEWRQIIGAVTHRGAAVPGSRRLSTPPTSHCYKKDPPLAGTEDTPQELQYCPLLYFSVGSSIVGS